MQIESSRRNFKKNWTMKIDTFSEISNLIDKKQIEKAQFELSKMHKEYQNNPEYLYLRSKIFYLSRLYYLAIDTLLVALEFEKNDKIYSLLGEIYKFLGNDDLSRQIFDKNLRIAAINEIKDSMMGLYRKKN